MADLFLIAEALGPKSANVIFFHGLGGDAYSTWSQHPKDKASFWPTWLARDIEGLSVYSVGYEAAASRWRGSAMHLIDRAPNVLASLLAERGLAAGPLILIGHSLGGLVIKQLLRTTESEARKREDAANFLRRVEKVAFLATPHTGADLAVWGDSLRIIVWPSAAAASLARNDPNLRDLNGWYRDWANQPKPGYPPVAHLILTETKPYGLLGMVVKPDSSDPGLANAQIVPTDCDHVAICKPKNDKSQIYRLVLSFILSPVERPKDPLPIIVEGQVRIEKNIDELPDDVAERVVALLDKREIAKAADAGLERATILELARPLRSGEVIDFDQAIVELRHAVSIALGVIAKGERGSNQEAFVEDVLKRLAETTKKGDFDSGAKAVDDALAEFDRREEEHRAASRRSRETLLEAGAEQDLLRRDPASVAQRIEAIAAMDSMDGNPAWSQKYRERWDAFYAEGDEKGINLSLEVAIEMARLMAASAREGDQRGTALDLLGNALRTLGERESGTARLEEAVAAYREALKENTREGAPLQWAVTQNNLGRRRLSRSLAGKDPRAPLEWATTQMNLGNALARLGERDSGTARLEEAVSAYREALQENTRERVPLDWAGTQMNLGNALATLGERESGTARLDEAVAAYREALQEWTRARVPLLWAKTQMNVGAALRALGERENGTARLEEAVAAYREALQENTRARVPLDWAMTQMNLGNALRALGERESGTARLEEAVSAYREALQEWTRARVPLEWAKTQDNLGVALRVLGERESGTARLTEAVSASREALQELTRARVPLEWAMTQMNLGNALARLGERESGTARLEEAVAAFREALQEYTRARVPLDWAFTQMNLALVYRALFDKEHQSRHLDDALEAADGALEEFRNANAAFYIEKAERQREKILAAKAN